MAPSKFQIYVDESIRQPIGAPVTTEPAKIVGLKDKNPPRYIRDEFTKNQRLYFNENDIYPISGGEYSFEELNLRRWVARQEERILRRRCEEAEREVQLLRVKLEAITDQQMARGPTSRLSIMPQSLQPAQGGLEYADMSVCDGSTTVVQGFYQDTIAGDRPTAPIDHHPNNLINDKFTVPIDQSQYIRETCTTSTPTSKDDKRARRMSRPSISGSPTLKLSPITETSRDCNSKSSSSSSAMSTTPGTARKPLVMEPMVIEDNRPLDPNDPSTYKRLLKMLAEPLDRRVGYVKMNWKMPEVKRCRAFDTEMGKILVDQRMSEESNVYLGQILADNPQDSDSSFPSAKSVCFRVDKPANDWLFYICNELHRRCQKTKPDIELSIMNADPAYMYTDGSILMDEHFRFVTLEDQLNICLKKGKSFPKSYSAYLALEMIQLIRGLHKCDIIHMNMNPKNIVITAPPTREDITSVDKRTSIIKLIGFDYALDMRLLPADFKFDLNLKHLTSCEMIDSKPWSYEVDWFCVLSCIHKMFFLEPMQPVKTSDRWKIDKQFTEFPTNCWSTLFDELLNINDLQASNEVVDQAIDELNTWFKANISFVMREVVNLLIILR